MLFFIFYSDGLNTRGLLKQRISPFGKKGNPLRVWPRPITPAVEYSECLLQRARDVYRVEGICVRTKNKDAGNDRFCKVMFDDGHVVGLLNEVSKVGNGMQPYHVVQYLSRVFVVSVRSQ